MKVNEADLKEAFHNITGQDRGSCPSPETLFDFVHQGLTKQERATWIHHIATCHDCAAESRILLSAQNPPQNKIATQRIQLLAIAACLLVAIGAGLYFLQLQTKTPQRLRIAFLDPTNNTNNQQLNALAAMLSTSMQQSGHLQVMSRTELMDAVKRSGKPGVSTINEDAIRAIRKESLPDTVAITTIEKEADGISIHVDLKDWQTGKRIYSSAEKATDLTAVPIHVDEISRSLRAQMKEDPVALENARRISELTTENLNAYYHYFRGEDLLNRLSFAEAQAELEKAVELDPTFAVAHYKLAFVRWTSEESGRDAIAKAMKHIRKAPRKEQNLIRAYDQWVKGHSSNALRIYESVLREFPEEKETLYMAGDVSFHAGDYKKSESYLKRVLVLDPSYGLAYDHLILIYESTDRFEPMLDLAFRFVQNVGSERSYKLYADAQNLRGEFEQTRRTYESARKIFTASAMPAIGIAEDVLIFQRRYQEAEYAALALLSESDEIKRQAYRSLTRIYAYQGKDRQALEAADKVIHIDRELGDNRSLARAHTQKAFWLLTLRNDPNGFQKEMQLARDTDTHADDFFYIYLFQNYLLAGQMEEARQIAKQNILAYGFYPDMLRAFQARKNQEFAEAIRILKDLEKRGEPWSRMLRTRELALSYLDAKRYRESFDSFEKLKKTYSNYLGHRAAFYPEALKHQIELLEKMGDKQQVQMVRQELLDLQK